MKQNFILVIILSAMLLMVNAVPHQLYQFHKRTTTYGPCVTGSPNALNVSMRPDPPAAGQNCLFTVGGIFSIQNGDVIDFQAFDSSGNSLTAPDIVDICSSAINGTKCPATSFNIVITVPMASTLPSVYIIAVRVDDAKNNTLACYMGTV